MHHTLIYFLVVCAASWIGACSASGKPVKQREIWSIGGDVIICDKYLQEDCGLSLKECGDDKSVEYSCLSEAVYLGQGDYLEPLIIDVPSQDPEPVFYDEAVPFKSGFEKRRRDL